MGLPATTTDLAQTRSKTVGGAKRTAEDPRKAAARDVCTAQQRLIDAEDALAEARAHLADKTKAFEALRNPGKRA